MSTGSLFSVVFLTVRCHFSRTPVPLFISLPWVCLVGRCLHTLYRTTMRCPATHHGYAAGAPYHLLSRYAYHYRRTPAAFYRSRAPLRFCAAAYAALITLPCCQPAGLLHAARLTTALLLFGFLRYTFTWCLAIVYSPFCGLTLRFLVLHAVAAARLFTAVPFSHLPHTHAPHACAPVPVLPLRGFIALGSAWNVPVPRGLLLPVRHNAVVLWFY